MDTIKVKLAQNQSEILKAKEVRRQVFQLEQGINSKLDFDGKDNKADHIIAYLDEKTIGTARIRYLSDKTVKLERLAVLKSYRKSGIGKKIMNYIINYLQEKGIKNIMLDSQEYAKNFYENFGFKQKGKIFDEVGIPHVEMWKSL